MKKGFQRHIGRVLPKAKTIFMSAIKDVTDRSLDYSDESAIPFWKEAYYSLIMLQKILDECDDLCFERDLEVCIVASKKWISNSSTSILSEKHILHFVSVF